MDRQRQQSSRGNATATRGGGSSGKGGGGGVGKAAGKKPIKVVYISNPMRVKTSAAGDADALVAAGHPAAAAAFDDEGGDGGYYDDDDDIFRSQLLDTSYSVFSPPTLLYDHPHSKV
uniref:VQ domain-containing protein n=1 Tax=Oryza meridionalis TaxID=40149 RepID=A0A0E0C987_9ORYZ